MPCEEMKRLQDLYEYHSGQVRYLMFNKELAGVSEPRRKKLIKDHQQQATTLSNAKYTHQQICEECKKETL